MGSPPGRRPGGAKAHIGEVQASVWDEQTLTACKEAGVILLYPPMCSLPGGFFGNLRRGSRSGRNSFPVFCPRWGNFLQSHLFISPGV